MSVSKIKATVFSQEQLASDVFSMWLEVGSMASEAKPGQFISVYSNDDSKLLPRPISICEIDKETGRLRIVYRVVGYGTKEFSGCKAGDTLEIMGPLGNGYTLKKDKAILVAGGIGVPPLFGAARQCGKNATVAVGFRNKDFVILEDDFRAAGCDLRIATDDGSYGHHGLVIDLFQDLHPDKIFACGPKVMLRAVTEFAKAHNIPCEISLEERMACGIGACLGCAVELYDENGETYMGHVCKDGPVFPAERVVF